MRSASRHFGSLLKVERAQEMGGAPFGSVVFAYCDSMLSDVISERMGDGFVVDSVVNVI